MVIEFKKSEEFNSYNSWCEEIFLAPIKFGPSEMKIILSPMDFKNLLQAVQASGIEDIEIVGEMLIIPNVTVNIQYDFPKLCKETDNTSIKEDVTKIIWVSGEMRTLGEAWPRKPKTALLRKCPFCGGEADLGWRGNWNEQAYIYCKECEAQTHVFLGGDPVEKAVKKWNQRI